VRTFLFLQGHPSCFSLKLAEELQRRGMRVLRINLCFGDAWFWRGLPAVNYRGRLGAWRSWLADYLEKEQVTEIIYYGDRKPYHRIAAILAKTLGINTYAYEFGYLRPDWISIERNGMSTCSHFPDDAEQIRKIATHFDAPDMQCRFPYTKAGELTNEIIYHFSSVFLGFLYPFYDADRYYNLFYEYLRGIPQVLFEKRNARKANALIQQLVKSQTAYFLYPLQLESDAQLRFHSPYAQQREAVDQVLQSFAKNAPEHMHLVFKVHPLDNGAERLPHFIRLSTSRLQIGERVHVIIGGNLNQLLEHAKGCVLINSTVGLHALQAGCPVKTLGTAIYDVQGMTDQSSLDSFWKQPLQPDAALTEDFVRALAGTIQVKGNFFSEQGIDAAVPELADRLIENRVNGYGAYVDPPPRAQGKPSIC